MILHVLVKFYVRCENVVPRSIWFFFQAEDGIRDLVRSRGLGDVYKRQDLCKTIRDKKYDYVHYDAPDMRGIDVGLLYQPRFCLLYTSDAADERSSVDLGGRRIIKKKTRTRKHD